VDETTEVEGVRILGATEAQEVSRTQRSPRTSKKAASHITTDQTSNVDLPHWSEAPTGEVPAAVVNAESPKDGWEALTGQQPRIRVDQSDWNEADYDPELSLNDDALNVGALGNDHVDLEDSFQQEVAQKRPTIAIGEEASSDTQRVARISTVPDSGTTDPIADVTAPGSAAPKIPRAKTSSRAMKENVTKKESAKEEPNSEVPSESMTLLTRTATALALAVVAIICFFAGLVPSVVLAAVVVGMMSLELCNAFRAIGSKPATLLVGVMSFFAVVAGYLIADRSVAVSAATFFVFSALWYLFAAVKARPVIGMSVSALVFVYVGLLGSFAGSILSLDDSAGKSIGIFILVATVLCVAANDTGAYLFGKFMGRTPLAPAISPNKTLEGTTAGIGAALVLGGLIGLFNSSSILGGLKGGIALGIFTACASTLGDLVESMLKRDCKIKDFGSLLPGHGGLMDRFDGLLFALPVAYYLALALR
jgi:phosphatidate cytidylyltransferase